MMGSLSCVKAKEPWWQQPLPLCCAQLRAGDGGHRRPNLINAPAEVVVESRKSRAALPAATPVAAPQARKKQDRVNS